MKAFVVTVRPGNHERYMDSVWLSFDHALERVGDLTEEFKSARQFLRSK